jgi:hypothetical protein
MPHLLDVIEDVETGVRLVGAALFALLFVRALRGPEAPPIRSAFWLLRRLGLAGGLALALVAGLNYLVNPLGIYSSRLFEPIVLHSRTEKMRLYRAASPRPEIVILGSSSSFTMAPAQIQERTGQTAFNASLHGGVPEDYLAFLRYMASLGTLPSLLIVPMSVEQVRPDLPAGFEPHNPLAPYIEREPRGWLPDLGRLVTLEQARASLRLLAAELRGRPPSHYRFDSDGRAHFRESPEPLDRIVDSYLGTREWSPGVYAFPDLDARQMSLFHRFLALARRLDVKVIVYVPPLYPRAVALYERESNLPALRAKLLERLHAWQAQGLIVAVHDFTRVESFGGHAQEFHDLAHPTAEASRRMLDLMLRPRRAGP